MIRVQSTMEFALVKMVRLDNYQLGSLVIFLLTDIKFSPLHITDCDMYQVIDFSDFSFFDKQLFRHGTELLICIMVHVVTEE